MFIWRSLPKHLSIIFQWSHIINHLPILLFWSVLVKYRTSVFPRTWKYRSDISLKQPEPVSSIAGSYLPPISTCTLIIFCQTLETYLFVNEITFCYGKKTKCWRHTRTQIVKNSSSLTLEKGQEEERINYCCYRKKQKGQLFMIVWKNSLFRTLKKSFPPFFKF